MLTGLPIQAATYYVSVNANSQNCVNAQNILTPVGPIVTRGLNCLSAGDTLRIMSGTYTTGNDRIDSGLVNFPGGNNPGSPTIIESNPGDTVTLTPTAAGISSTAFNSGGWYIVYLRNQNNVTVRNLHLLGSTTDSTRQYPHIFGVEASNNVTLSGNEIAYVQHTVNGSPGGCPDSWLGSWDGSNGLLQNNSMHDARSDLNCNSGNNDGYDCYCHASGLTFDGNEIYNAGNWGVHWNDGTNATNENNGVFKNNIFHDNGKDQPTGSADLVFANNSPPNNSSSGHLVYNNLFYNTLYALDLRSYTTTGSGTNITVANNTIINEPGAFTFALCQPATICDYGNFNKIYNNIVLNGSGINGGGTNSTRMNNICDSTAPACGTNSSPSTAAVEFQSTTPSAPNYLFLNSGAVSRGKGVNLSTLFTVDKANNPRVAVGAWDDGAYVFVSTSSIPVLAMNSFRRSR